MENLILSSIAFKCVSHLDSFFDLINFYFIKLCKIRYNDVEQIYYLSKN